ncbi:uncharacterized protein ATNIH1004_002054 [Aspergillus tanneri]|uniref:Uncharacterized protein n=1 Tax=Aspergillus tanneri TaxID=1220188 RepID=A0A5M9M7L4_9EURO|nr:uncharacterized protein ATNIH1004_002054 [Aspergillus tanneri]KAA8641314.1 hypothetical protein ATNIH1004_002054 [Aspergillus tanneri]
MPEGSRDICNQRNCPPPETVCRPDACRSLRSVRFVFEACVLPPWRLPPADGCLESTRSVRIWQFVRGEVGSFRMVPEYLLNRSNRFEDLQTNFTGNGSQLVFFPAGATERDCSLGWASPPFVQRNPASAFFRAASLTRDRSRQSISAASARVQKI